MHRCPRILVAASLALTLLGAGCAGRREEPPVGAAAPEIQPVPAPAPAGSGRSPPATRGNMPFYEVEGRRYFVLPDSRGYQAQGVASWYGREFHGRSTSSGEIYDMYALTAAHKTLPLPTTARVTNLATGKSIVVRINDRGPFRKDRLIDLSYAAARELGIVTAGTGQVEVQALDESSDADARAGAQAMYLQVAAFGARANAERLRERLEREGFERIVIHHDGQGGSSLHRVRIGPVQSAEEFDALAQRIGTLDLGPPQLVVEQAAPAALPGS